MTKPLLLKNLRLMGIAFDAGRCRPRGGGNNLDPRPGLGAGGAGDGLGHARGRVWIDQVNFHQLAFCVTPTGGVSGTLSSNCRSEVM